MKKRTLERTCECKYCGLLFHRLGIARHRKACYEKQLKQKQSRLSQELEAETKKPEVQE